MTRDITKKQFVAALARHSMKPVGFMGYVEICAETGLSVSYLNAGPTWRARLAYLLAARDAENKRLNDKDGGSR